MALLACLLWPAAFAQAQFTLSSGPDYVTVTFPAKTIDTVMAVAPSSNNSGNGSICGVRDYQFQVSSDGTNWQAVKTVTGNTIERALYATISPQTIQGMRLVIMNINNGHWYDDYNGYPYYDRFGNLQVSYGSPRRAMIYELEAYGPSGQSIP